MKRLFCVIAFIASFCTVLSAQVSKELLHFPNTVHDFGQVLLGDGAISCTFEGTNVSGKDLTILSVSTSCGCTNVTYTHGVIKPGAKAVITATYTNDEGPYPFDKTLTIKLTGVQKPILLHLRGISQKEIKPDKDIYTEVFASALGMEKKELKCGNLEQGGARSDQFTVANLSAKPIKLSFAEVSKGLKVDVSPNPIPAGAHATVTYTVTSSPDLWGYNWYSAVPVVDGINSGKSFKVKAFTAENFTNLTKEEKAKGSRPVFDESTFSFGHKKKGAKLTATFVCSNKGQADLKIYKADSDYDKAVPSAFPVIAPGKSGKFTVELDTSDLPEGEALVMITLTTNSPQRPIVTLFLAGIID